jgi:deoxyadenosine/deoxycytidine kinase
MSIPLDITINNRDTKFQKVLDVFKDTRKKFIVIDGIISAGKTTLIKLIEKRLNTQGKLKVKAIFEPVDLWNKTGALQYFYEDIPKRCYEFQTYTFITRINTIIENIYDCPDADVYILERSIWTDQYIFMELLKDHVGDLRMEMYKQWCHTWAYIMPMRVDTWVFLDTSLEESLKRIKIRNRSAEGGVDEAYQTQLYNKHVEFYDKLKDKENCGKVIKIENNLMDSNFITDENVLISIIARIGF